MPAFSHIPLNVHPNTGLSGDTQSSFGQAGNKSANATLMAAMNAVMGAVSQVLKQVVSQGGMGGGMPMSGGMPMAMGGVTTAGTGMPIGGGLSLTGAHKPMLGGQMQMGPISGLNTGFPMMALMGGMTLAGGVMQFQPSQQAPAANVTAGLTAMNGQAQAPTGPAMPSRDDKAPAGKTAQQILNETPLLKELGYQKDLKIQDLKKQVGDFETDPDAAQRLKNVVDHIKALKGRDGSDRGKIHTNGKIEGLSKRGDVRHGTEAGVLKDFAEKGYDTLPKERLPMTKDSHVRINGTTMNNFQWVMKKAGEKLFFIPGLSNVLKGIGNAEGGVGSMFKGAFEGVFKTWKNDAEGAVNALKTGKISPNQVFVEMYKANLNNSEEMPQFAKELMNKMPGQIPFSFK